MEKTTFLSRKEILDILRKRLTDFQEGYRQNIAILGGELTGKTTLLKTFIKDIPSDKLITIYTEVSPFEFTLFIKRFLDSLFYHFLQKMQLVSSRENLDILIKMSKEHLPQSAELAEQLLAKLDKEKPEILFKEMFSILETFSCESKKRCVVIIDEFHNLKKLAIKNICQELGKKIMFQKDTLFIFSSSAKKEAKEILSDDLSLLFGHFETIEIQMLSSKECEELIEERLTGINIQKKFIDFLINFTGGHPFYLKKICDKTTLQCKINQITNINKDTLTSAIEALLFEEYGIFNLKFSALMSQLTIGKNKNELVSILSAISIGKNKLKELTTYLKRQRLEITQKLNKLIEIEAISKNGSFYTINDRLLCFWLKFVYFEKTNSLSPDHAEQAIHFKARINAEIDEFINTSQRNIPERMLELFNLFEGDNIQMERKLFELSSFKELRLMSFDETNLKIGIFGKSQDNIWLAAIKEDGIREQDINDLIQLAAKFKSKTINKIIIGLGDVERNARLLAKESRIITWDIASINSILDLYGKPRIIK